MTFIRGGAVYIMTNKNNTTLYVGVTSRLKERVWEHKSNKFPKSFTARYSLHKLVYYQGYAFIEEAIKEEDILKGKSRQKKNDLINKFNPDWLDLFDSL